MVGGLLDRMQRLNRQRKARWISEFIHERDIKSVLIVGSTGLVTSKGWENLVERSVSERVERVVWSGLAATGCEPYVRADGLALPFSDHAFDLVLSNAVIEHVGGEAEQSAFVSEHRRVGRSWVLTTPNLWFPVEAHTRILFLHWSPAWRASQASFTRLLSKRTLLMLVDRVRGWPVSPTFIGWGPSDWTGVVGPESELAGTISPRRR